VQQFSKARLKYRPITQTASQGMNCFRGVAGNYSCLLKRNQEAYPGGML